MKLYANNHGGDVWATYAFWCPGCKKAHVFTVNPGDPRCWNFNGNMDRPTFTPSLMVNRGEPDQCHLNLTDGHIYFHPDCHHSLAGRVVELQDRESVFH